jgi:hypothetical protein
MRDVPRKWTKDDLNYLRENIETKSIKELAAFFDVSPDAIRHCLKRERLSKKGLPPSARPMREVKAIYRYAKAHTEEKAAAHFGLSLHTIKNVKRRYAKSLKKSVEKCSSEFVEKQRRFAIGFARKKGLSHLAEDFASFVVIEILQGRTPNLPWLFVDFKRKAFGLKCKADSDASVYSVQNALNLDDVEVEGSLETDLTNKWVTLVEELGLSGRDRLVFLLHYQIGLCLNSIAFMMGCAPSYISLRLKDLHLTLRGKMDPTFFEVPEKVWRMKSVDELS